MMVVLMLARRMLVAVSAFAMILSCAAAVVASAETLPDRAIVNAHPLQPRADQFSGASSHTPRDVSSSEAKEINQLYRQLMREVTPPTSQSR